MEGFDPRTSFGYEESKRYDAVDTRGDEEQTVAFLAQLAGLRDVLEFAVGTGRIALPLVKAGLRVDGIELSQDMVDRMREKPDGDTVTVTMGDMARVTTDAPTGWSTSSTTRSATCSRRTTRSDASRTPPTT